MLELSPGHRALSKKDMRELWDERVVLSLGSIDAAEFSGPIEWVGEGDRSVALGRGLRGRPVVVKVVFEGYDHLVGAWMGGGIHRGVAEIISVGQWVDDPRNLFAGHGVVVQERVCMFMDVLEGRCPAFTRDEAQRLYEVVDHLLHPDDPDHTGADDPFADDLRAGLAAIEERVALEYSGPLVDDLHLGNVGLVVRDREAQAVLIDLGVVGSGTRASSETRN